MRSCSGRLVRSENGGRPAQKIGGVKNGSRHCIVRGAHLTNISFNIETGRRLQTFNVEIAPQRRWVSTLKLRHRFFMNLISAFTIWRDAIFARVGLPAFTMQCSVWPAFS